jgi:hypothetical protein
VLAGTVLALSHRTQLPISEGRDPMAARFARLARYLDASPELLQPDLSFADVEVELGIKAAPERRVLLGAYTLEWTEFVLFRFGILGFLERRGYGGLRVEFGTASTGGDRVTVTGEAGGQRHTLVECVLERQTIDGHPTLYIHWLSLRDPQARFSERRPKLPGQDVPGLGVAREATELLVLMAQQLGLEGVAFRPAFYHTAYVARAKFAFVDPVRQGEFEALVRDFRGKALDVVSVAASHGTVRHAGGAYQWEPSLMASWARHEGEAAERLAAVREATHFALDEDEEGPSRT